MKSAKKCALLASTLALTILGSSASFADDCNRVTFQFKNRWTVGTVPVDIKIKKISISGSQGAWDENLDNKRIKKNDSHTTRQRRLNKLDAGETGAFTVHFDHKRIGAGWDSATHGPFDIRCNDGDVIPFTIMHN